MIRTDDLILGGYKLLQEEDKFCFGTDAVLLYNMIPVGCGRTVDLCSGSGVVAMLLLAGQKAAHVTAVEKQADGCRLCAESARINGCADRLDIIEGDICKISHFLSEGFADTVCVNPPYFRRGSAILPPDPSVAMCRHETDCTIEDVFAAAAYLLKEGGGFYMVHRTERRDEILQKIKKYDLNVRRLVQVFSKPQRPSKLFLLEAQKGGSVTEYTTEEFTVMDPDGSLSDAYRRIYTPQE